MIKDFKEHRPNIHKECFIASSAAVIGSVTLEKDCNVWFGAVIRGDEEPIVIGEGTNIQDNCIIHTSMAKKTTIGSGVTIGHGAIVHGCTVENNVLIGMGSIVLDGAVIGENTIVGAGALVTPNKVIPSGVLCVGAPAKVVRELTQEEIESIKHSAKSYIEKSKEYMHSPL